MIAVTPRCVFVLVLAGSGLLMAARGAHGASIDLASEFTAGTVSVEPGGLATYDVSYSNLSAFAPSDSYLNVTFPAGAFLDDQSVSFEVQDSLGNVGFLYLASSCEALMVQIQGPGDDDNRPIPLDLPPNTTGVMGLTLKMPMQPVTTRALRVQYPDSQPRDLDFNVGVCDDCDDPSSCFGPRISSIVPALEADYVIVDDEGYGGGTLGCQSIKNDVAGKIALARRGDCEFGLKAINAQIAGALACVIMNNDPDQNLRTFSMRGGEFGSLVNIPVALISNEDADPIEAAIVAGENLVGLIGGVQTERLEFTSLIFHSGDSDQDPDPSNDADTFVTLISLFADGFESGDTSFWSDTVQ